MWSIAPLMLLVLAFLIPTLAWIHFKKPLNESSQLSDVKRELQKVRFNDNYIQSVFSNQHMVPPVFSDMNTAKLGDSNAPNILTIVTNPLCGICSKIHHEINKLQETSQRIQCQFIFLGPPNALEIAANFLDSPISEQKELMDSWYQNIQQNVRKWINIHQMNIEKDNTAKNS